MEWLTQTIITLSPLSLAVLLFAAMCLGWVIYGLRGYKYWLRRFHHYKLPRRRRLKKNYGYVEYVPEVVNVTPVPRPQPRQPQVIHKVQKNEQARQMRKEILSTKDDLQVVEGIGPKIEEILNNQGIYTWRELAATPASNISHMLERAGKQFTLHDPETWPQQANMADQGNWDELKKWQDELYKGIQLKKA
ncbi:MAG: hypothetical protein MRY57_03735 [Candidatus Pacebacteria bacterium]|nr:hypothetical protein [Candidatus Paceibacterota bacterium]